MSTMAATSMPLSSAIFAVLRPRLPDPKITMRCAESASYRLISEWAPLAPIAPPRSQPANPMDRSRDPVATMRRSYFIIQDRSWFASPICGPSRSLLFSELRKAPQTQVPSWMSTPASSASLIASYWASLVAVIRFHH